MGMSEWKNKGCDDSNLNSGYTHNNLRQLRQQRVWLSCVTMKDFKRNSTAAAVPRLNKFEKKKKV